MRAVFALLLVSEQIRSKPHYPPTVGLPYYSAVTENGSLDKNGDVLCWYDSVAVCCG